MDFDSYLKGCMSPMMWGLYADKTKGVCIELDYNKIQFPHNCLKGIVRYKAILNKYQGISQDVKTESDLNRFIIKHQKELFFTKNKCWSGENEYRILSKEDCFLNIKLVNGKIPIQIFTHAFAPDNSAIPIIKKI